MEKQLLLLRHAKAEVAESGRPDHDRALAPRGVEDAYRIGRYLAQQAIDPDLILCSTALRTRQTEEQLRSATLLSAETLFLAELYLAPANEILQIVRAFAGSQVRSLMVIGHNPGLEECAARLTGEVSLLSTSALAMIGLKTGDFTQLGQSGGILRGIVTARSLPLTSD